MPARSPHSWTMACLWPLTDDQADLIFHGKPVDLDPEAGNMTGPGCAVCHQAYAIAYTLPCPGAELVAQVQEVDRRSVMPRKERRALAHRERRGQPTTAPVALDWAKVRVKAVPDPEERAQ